MPNDAHEDVKMLLNVNKNAKIVIESTGTVLIRLQADLGYKPRPQTSQQKINLINTNCKCVILGYKPRAIFGLEVYRRP